MHNREALKLSACAFAPFAIRFGLMLLSTSHSLRIGVKGAVIGLISASTDTCLNVSFLSTSWEKRKRKKAAKLGTLRSGQCPDLSHGLIRYAKPLLRVR